MFSLQKTIAVSSPPFFDFKKIIKRFMVFEIIPGFYFNGNNWFALLYDKVDFSDFLFIVVAKLKMIGGKDLGKDVFENTAHIDR